MSIHIYPSYNGFWRAEVNGRVHPLLVGFNDLEKLIAKVNEIIPSIDHSPATVCGTIVQFSLIVPNKS